MGVDRLNPNAGSSNLSNLQSERAEIEQRPLQEESPAGLSNVADGLEHVQEQPDIFGAQISEKANLIQHLQDSDLLYLAMLTMAKADKAERQDAGESMQAATQAKLDAAAAEIEAMKQEIDQKRSAAMQGFAQAIAIGAVTVAASAAGAVMADSFGSAVTGAEGLISAKDRLDQADLTSRRAEMLEAQVDQQTEDAKSQYEEAKEVFKQALRTIAEAYERNSSVVQKITI